MLGAGTVINPIIKIVTTVVILAAVGIFIVRPVLDTTDKAINSVNDQINDARNQSQQAQQQASDDFDLDFARTRAETAASSLQSEWPAAARKIKACIKAAGSDVAPMQRCEDFASRLQTTVRSDRTFALSYANTLDAQGDAAAAERIRNCVKDAGFRAAAMNRCRNLANDLLFG